jgi:hypothetical protein
MSKDAIPDPVALRTEAAKITAARDEALYTQINAALQQDATQVGTYKVKIPFQPDSVTAADLERITKDYAEKGYGVYNHGHYLIVSYQPRPISQVE